MNAEQNDVNICMQTTKTGNESQIDIVEVDIDLDL